MAGTPTVTRVGRIFSVDIVLTAQAGSTETAIPNLPTAGSIIAFRAKKLSGDGATIAPTVGRAASWTAATADEVVASFATAGASVVNENMGANYVSATGTLYIRPTPASGSNNAVTLNMLIESIEES